MLILGLFLLLLVSAISTERINGIIIYRSAAIILLYSFILSVTTLDVSILGSGIGVFGGLYQITVISKIMECFIYLIAGMILANTMLILTSSENNLSMSGSLSLETLRNKNLTTNKGFNVNSTDSINDENKDETESWLTSGSGSALKNIDYTLKQEYPLIALFTIVGSVLLISSNDLVSMYLSIELQSFSLYILATIYRDSQGATSAGLKYFLLGGLSSGFILLGSSILYAYLGVTNLESIYLLLTTERYMDLTSTSLSENNLGLLTLTNLLKFKEIGLLILLTGFLFKIAAAPLHNWSPDVYDGVPTKVTCWLAVIAKISILIFLLDLVMIAGNGNGNIIATELDSQLFNISISSLSNLLFFSAFLSLLIGTIVGLAQSRIKRLYAYSTISHLGFLLLAMAINTEDSIESFIFYLIQYSLTSANAFFVLIAFGSLSLTLTGGYKSSFNSFSSVQTGMGINTKSLSLSHEEEYSPVQFISQLKGQFRRKNSTSILLALSLSVILFSMAGIPPLIGFFAKQSVLLSAVKNGFVFLSIIAIIASVISAAYYLRIIKVMLFDPYKEDDTSKKPLVKFDPYSENTLSEITSSQDLGLKLNSTMLPSNANKSLLLETIDKSYISQSYKGSISNSLSFSIALLTVLTIFFVFKPLLILNAAHIMALSVFYI